MHLRTAWLILVLFMASRAMAQGGARLPDAHAFTRFPLAEAPGRAQVRDLPPRVDLSTFVPPAGDQGQSNTCTGWAVGYGLCTTIRADLARDSALHRTSAPPPDRVLSPAYIYALALGGGTCNSDVRLADALRMAVDSGCCTWALAPFDTVRAATACHALTAEARAQAPRFRLTGSTALPPRSAEAMRQQLAAGNLIVLSANVEDRFVHDGNAAAGTQPFTWQPAGFDNSFSHAMLCLGYDEADGSFLVQNSWGLDWGYHGTFRMPYDVAEHYVTEAYAVPVQLRALELGPPPHPADTTTARRHAHTLAEGDQVMHGNVVVHATDITTSTDSLLLRVHAADGGQLLHAVHLPMDQSCTVYHHGQAYSLTYGRAVNKGQAARLRIVVRPQEKDPALRAALRHVQRFWP